MVRLGDVLGVGCGDGWTAGLLKGRCASYTGVDRSEAVVEAARQRAPFGKFVVGEMGALPFQDGSFDHVLVFHALTYVQAAAEPLAEMARVLRPGGELVVLTLAAHRNGARAAAFGHVRAGYDVKRLATKIRRSGLRVARCEVTSREKLSLLQL